VGEIVYTAAGISNEGTLPSARTDLLLNVPNAGLDNKAIKQAQRLLKKAQPRCFILDSGGYEILKEESRGKQILHDPTKPMKVNGVLNLTPQHVIDTARILMPDIVIALDYPIRKRKYRCDREAEFRAKYRINIRWSLETAHLRMTYLPQIRLFLPVQCYTIPQFDVFYSAVGHVSHDGVAMPIRNMNLHNLASFFRCFRDHGIRQVHILGTAIPRNLALSAYAAACVFDWVSIDGTTWRWEAQSMKYLSPCDLSSIHIKSVKECSTRYQSCLCPYCSRRSVRDFYYLPDTEKRYHLMWHNYWVTVNYITKMHEQAKLNQGFDKYLINRLKPPTHSDVLQAIKVLHP